VVKSEIGNRDNRSPLRTSSGSGDNDETSDLEVLRHSIMATYTVNNCINDFKSTYLYIYIYIPGSYLESYVASRRVRRVGSRISLGARETEDPDLQAPSCVCIVYIII
jgi:hypothetical protein